MIQHEKSAKVLPDGRPERREVQRRILGRREEDERLTSPELLALITTVNQQTQRDVESLRREIDNLRREDEHRRRENAELRAVVRQLATRVLLAAGGLSVAVTIGIKVWF